MKSTQPQQVAGGTKTIGGIAANSLMRPIIFATEIQRPRRGNQVLERFRNYDVSPDAIQRLTASAGNAELLKDAQLHALALINSVYPLPKVSPLNQIPLPELTESEKALPKEEKLAQSKIIALGAVAKSR